MRSPGPRRRFALVDLIALAIVLLLGICACSLDNSGERPRYTGRVVSVSSTELCLGPNTSSPSGTCAAIPQGATALPKVGDCVSLLSEPVEGDGLRWSMTDLNRVLQVDSCA